MAGRTKAKLFQQHSKSETKSKTLLQNQKAKLTVTYSAFAKPKGKAYSKPSSKYSNVFPCFCLSNKIKVVQQARKS